MATAERLLYVSIGVTVLALCTWSALQIGARAQSYKEAWWPGPSHVAGAKVSISRFVVESDRRF